MHEVAATAKFVYLPEVQYLQTSPPTEYVPGAQLMQSTTSSDPLAEDLPAAQLEHVSAVVAAMDMEYLPASQAVHVVSLPSGENLPEGQLLQALVATSAFASNRNFPEVQYEQLSLLLASLH